MKNLVCQFCGFVFDPTREKEEKFYISISKYVGFRIVPRKVTNYLICNVCNVGLERYINNILED